MVQVGITILQGLHNGGSHVADQFKIGEPSSLNNNNVHLSCAHQRPERSHDTY